MYHQKIRLQDEINSTKEDDMSAKFKISSKQVKISFHNLVKYSRIIREEIKRNDIFSELNKSIQKVQIRNENSINTFLHLLNDEEAEIKNDEFIDLLKLSELFKVDQLKSVLNKYLHNHSKDVDFILNLKIEQENSNEEITILTDDLTEEMEDCLKSNINECLKNNKINKITVSSIYRMIERSCRDQISNDLLCRFIFKSIEERHVLFRFICVEKLSSEVFEEMMKLYEKFNKSDNDKTHYFDFLPNHLSYMNKLIEKQKLLEKRIQELEKINVNIMKENQQYQNQNEELKIINQENEVQHKEELMQKEQKIKEIQKINQQIEEQMKEELIQKEKEIEEIRKIQQHEEKKQKELNQMVAKKENTERKNRLTFEIIKELLTKYDLKSYNKSGISFNIHQNILQVACQIENQYLVKYILSLKTIDINYKTISFFI